MLRYLIRRLVALVPTFLLASVIVFSAIRLIPGNTIDMMMSQNDISASVQTREDLIKALGLDQPVEEGVLRIALVGRDEGPQALHDLGHGLQKLGLAGVALFDVGQELLEGLIFHDVGPMD